MELSFSEEDFGAGRSEMYLSISSDGKEDLSRLQAGKIK
jgi:hypothetical protein